MAGLSASPEPTTLTVSPGMSAWLRQHDLSIAFTSFNTGQLFLAGAHPNGTLAINQQPFGRATGLHWRHGRLWVATDRAIYRLEDAAGEGIHDVRLVPRAAIFTGDIATGEISEDADRRLIFVTSRFGCLAVPDDRYAFRRLWRPSNTGEAAHLSGLAMTDAGPAYVTAFQSGADVSGTDGGVLIDVIADEILMEGMSLPHSPRVESSDLYVIEAGRGRLLRYDVASGNGRQAALLPGFARGLALHDGFAITTLSRSHRSASLDRTLERRGVAPWCGIAVVDLATGEIVEWIRLDGYIAELFDVAVLPGVRCPSSVSPFTDEQLETIDLARADSA